MVTSLGSKLLQMTKGRMRISLEEIQKELGTESLEEQVESLKQEGLVTANHEFLEVTSRQRVMLAESLVRAGQDAQQVSRLLAWREFEEFVEAALDQSGFRSARHVMFKGTVGRREIDVLAWNDVWILVVDCKHWSGALAPSRMKGAAEAQVERVRALAERPEIMRRLGIPRIDLPLTPLLLTLGEPRDRLIGGVPIVGLSSFSSFLQEASPYVDGFLSMHVQATLKQGSLTSHIPTRKRNRMPNLTQDADPRGP
jgi:hypothetical protein